MGREKVSGFWFVVHGVEFRISCFVFWGFGFRVPGFGKAHAKSKDKRREKHAFFGVQLTQSSFPTVNPRTSSPASQAEYFPDKASACDVAQKKPGNGQTQLSRGEAL